MGSDIALGVAGLFGCVISAIFAKSKGYNPVLWFFAGSVIGLLVLWFYPKLNPPASNLSKEKIDDLKISSTIIALVLIGILYPAPHLKRS